MKFDFSCCLGMLISLLDLCVDKNIDYSLSTVELLVNIKTGICTASVFGTYYQIVRRPII